MAALNSSAQAMRASIGLKEARMFGSFEAQRRPNALALLVHLNQQQQHRARVENDARRADMQVFHAFIWPKGPAASDR